MGQRLDISFKEAEVKVDRIKHGWGQRAGCDKARLSVSCLRGDDLPENAG